MSEESREAVGHLLHAAREGDEAAIGSLFESAYQELRQLAHLVRRDESGHTLNTTALVHEAYFKLVPSKGLPAESMAHFKHIVGRAMRQVLVDRARARTAQKRGGGTALVVTLSDDVHGPTMDDARLIRLHEALAELEQVDARSARVVECRFFGGLNVVETAAALGISSATVKRDWRVARAWLSGAMA